MLGASRVDVINLYPDSHSEADRLRYAAYFPEATVTRAASFTDMETIIVPIAPATR